MSYGSNTNLKRFRAYLTDAETDGRYADGVETRWVQLDNNPVYFAGESKTWGGAVAFCSLVTHPSRPYPAVAYGLTPSDLAIVLAKENGLHEIGWVFDVDDLEVGGWTALPVALAADGYRGKYNALLRLPDIEGEPAFTVTTSHLLKIGAPDARYFDTILEGLASRVGEHDARRLLETATAVSARTNQDFVDLRADKTITWSGKARPGRSTGLVSVRLPTAASGAFDEPTLRLGTLELLGTRVAVWVNYSLADGQTAELSPGLVRLAGRDDPVVRVTSALPVELRRIPGYLADLASPDVVQVDPAVAAQLGRWALAITSDLSGPVRVVSRSHVPEGAVRVSYGVRTILGLQADDHLLLAPLDQECVRHSQLHAVAPRSRVVRRLTLFFRGLGEMLLGAPPVALRATEGLVGDDGRAVVRVDSTALDYLGLKAGDQALLSWGTRVTKVRVLLQTDVTRERMEDQLSESTGFQSRNSLGVPHSRKRVPTHLRVWVSPTVRKEIDIPPDTVVRLRRDVPYVLRTSAATLVVPFAGLAVAALAVPGVPLWTWVVVLVVALVLTLLPLRLTDSSGHRSWS